MVTYYKPVLNYDLSFDCDKGEKHKMDIYSSRTHGTGRNAQVKWVKKTAEVRVCESTNVDETIWTVNKFERELEITGMAWRKFETSTWLIMVEQTAPPRKMDSS